MMRGVLSAEAIGAIRSCPDAFEAFFIAHRDQRRNQGAQPPQRNGRPMTGATVRKKPPSSSVRPGLTRKAVSR